MAYVSVKEKKKQAESTVSTTPKADILKRIGMVDFEPASFKTRLMELQDLTSLYRLKYVVSDHFKHDAKNRNDIERLIDQRINSL